MFLYFILIEHALSRHFKFTLRFICKIYVRRTGRITIQNCHRLSDDHKLCIMKIFSVIMTRTKRKAELCHADVNYIVSRKKVQLTKGNINNVNKK